MTGTLRTIERFLLPNACVACGRGVDAGDPDALVCGLCQARLRALPPGCHRCQQPLPLVGPCRFCRDWPDTLRHVRSAVWLDDIARSVVHHLKYGGLARIGTDTARVMRRCLPSPGHGVLVPVPLSPSRERRRGYNQAAAIAGALGAVWRLPVADDVLARTRETGTQTALTPTERLANMVDAFVARGPATAGGPARGGSAPTVILVDDVLTTGATLAACATALDGAGWGAVDAVTFARAMPYELRVP